MPTGNKCNPQRIWQQCHVCDYKIGIVQNTLTAAIDLTKNCLDTISSNIQNIKENNKNLPKTLNGPQSSISNKTYQSINAVNWGLNQLTRNVLHYGDFVWFFQGV